MSIEMQVRPAAERGQFDHGWLKTAHTFSFADYYEPRFMGFRALRVINEDYVAPARGFGKHPHRDMEIITYVLEGEVAHQDSMGNGSTIRPGEVQRMSAGTGVLHSEMNPSKTQTLHLLQIWLLPDKPGHAPGYEQKAFSDDERRGKLRVVASPDGRDGSVTIHQDATLAAALLDPGQQVEHVVRPKRYAWLQVARGAVDVGGHTLKAGDGAAVRGDGALVIEGVEAAEVLVFDLA
ncbi:MAG: pirin family protein [Acidobacteriota bacterium]